MRNACGPRVQRGGLGEPFRLQLRVVYFCRPTAARRMLTPVYTVSCAVRLPYFPRRTIFEHSRTTEVLAQLVGMQLQKTRALSSMSLVSDMGRVSYTKNKW